MDNADLQVQDLTKHYGSVVALEGVDLALAKGEFFALLGPSGSGKTTLLRLVAGFIEPSRGRILLGGQEVQALPPHRRNVGMVFQNYALFPHLTVFENVAFGLQARRISSRDIRSRVDDALRLVQLSGLGERYPRQLSGGQQQRVALARALVIQPRVFLLDEPLGALDRKLRAQMQVELRQLQRAVGVTTLLVTHDQEEALTLSDRVGVLREGRIAQVGTPAEVYERPCNRFVADFLGQANFFDGKVVGQTGDVVTLSLAGDRQLAGRTASAMRRGQPATLMIRPERVSLTMTPAPGSIEGRLLQCLYAGPLVTYVVILPDGTSVSAIVPNDELPHMPGEGEAVWLQWDQTEAWVMPTEAEEGDL